MKPFNKALTWILLSCILLSLMPIFASQGADRIIFQGYVLDAYTEKPLPGALVIISSFFYGVRRVEGRALTDPTGFYRTYVPMVLGDASYEVYVLLDHPETFGIDYMVGFRSFNPSGAKGGDVFELKFELIPGASIMVEGDILSVEEPDRAPSLEFDLIDPASGARLSVKNIYLPYKSSINVMLGLGPRTIIAPANTLIGVMVKAYWGPPKPRQLAFIIDNDGVYFNLAQGSLVKVDARKYSLKHEVASLKEASSSVEAMLNEARWLGFYIQVEVEEFLRAKGLVEKAEGSLSLGRYDECFLNLREAYLAISRLSTILKDMYLEAATFSIASAPIIIFSSALLAFLLFEKGYLKVASFLSFYILMFYLLFLTHPGFKLIDLEAVAKVNIPFLIATLLLLSPRPHLLRKLFKASGVLEELSSTLSFAKRSLRSRKLRTSLALASMAIFIFSFTTLTSFSMGQGVNVVVRSVKNQPEGMLVRRPFELSFSPLDPSAVEWLKNKPEVALVAPKAENTPSPNPLFYLASLSNKSIPIYGVIGVSPKEEASFTRIEASVSRGAYLSVESEEAVLISEKAARYLGVDVGDLVSFLNKHFMVIGLFRDSLINQVKEIDGKTIRPLKWVPVDPKPLPCEGHEFIILTLHAALKIPGVAISRVNLKVWEAKDMMAFAHRIVIERNYWVWVSAEGKLYIFFFGPNLQVKGAYHMLLPVIIVSLNVGFMMLNVVYESRKEAAILTTLGVNPTKLIAIFIAEATIIGLIGGMLGYFISLGSYRILPHMSTPPPFKSKVSITWSLATLLLSTLTAILASAIPALKAAKMATPSLPLKWEMKPVEGAGGKWVLKMPALIKYLHIEPFLNYVEERLTNLAGIYEKAEGVKRVDEQTYEGAAKKLRFRYVYGEGERSIITDNELIASKPWTSQTYDISLSCQPAPISPQWPPEIFVRKTASFTRRLILEWSILPSEQKLRRP